VLWLTRVWCLQDHDADADSAFADVAHGLAAVLEGGAISVVLLDLLFFSAFFDACRVPQGDCNERCEP
jgi:hypothetical protein